MRQDLRELAGAGLGVGTGRPRLGRAEGARAGRRLGKRGALMTFRPHPVPAWAVLAASGCLSPALPQVMFLQRKGQVIMTIELLDTEEAQTEDPVEVQVRTAALHSKPCAHLGS